ncbi:AraC family transcriptional regulator [Pusillimonas sp. T7-7]|uniref:helix-turn-helix domain-containing protein n=1 Tax=Pusillimonas sp. (strain T7-7) TaxID=1007105 RepID=UPI0002085521|nr:helix-turn-helix domain-containing protein [Pusillimonas sp. T7-7]AEC19665.1 AraC family transcriptional regulator [Pusillimonas sp. T7-7]
MMVAWHQTLQDPYEQAKFQNWLPIEINQISAGHYSGYIRMLEHDEVSVCWESQSRTIHKRSVIDQDSCTVSFFRNQQFANGFSEYAPAEGSLFILPAGAELDIRVAANVETVYFRFNQSVLLHKARAMDPSRWEAPPTCLLCLDLGNLESLDRFAGNLFHLAQVNNQSASDGNNEALSNIITEHILMALNSSRLISTEKNNILTARRRAKYTVNRVVDYIKAQLEQHVCPSISTICTDLQLSERTLQYSFGALLDVSPYTYLRYMRLNGVRAALMQPDNDNITITRVASHWHFLHMGRFSKDYQRMFGELPSTTLRQARHA